MKTGAGVVCISTVVVVLAVAFATQHGETSRPPARASEIAAAKIATTPTESGALIARTSGAFSPSVVRTPNRRPATEVFPGSLPSDGNWRLNHPARMTVAPHADLPVSFDVKSVKEDGRHLTWIGRNPRLPGASFVGVATPNGYDAILLLPGASQFNFHVRDGEVLVEEVVSKGSDCALWDGPLPRLEPASSGIHYAEAVGPIQGGNAEGGTPSGLEAPLGVDVLFLYNTRAFALASERSSDPIGYLDGYTRAALETSNLVLQQSRVDRFSWRYVGLVAAPEYPAKETVPEDLAMMAPGESLHSFVQTARAQHGADQVMMWVGPGTRQGAAYVGSGRHDPAPKNATLAALRLTAGVLILAHELGHNFGCRHDRGHAGSGDGSTATPDGDGYYSYCVLWTDPGATTTSGTVMAYADFLVPYFSNPNITLNVTSTMQNRSGPFRELGTHTIGFPESDPRAAYNARILNDNAAYMASVSEEVAAMPVIVQQPQDIAIVAGQALALTVSATGRDLRYQWSKDGAAIAGATSATYSRIVASADAGAYQVVVSNSSGSATSRTAAVTVASAAGTPQPNPVPVPNPQTGGGAGGGGGGAPSWWFVGALAALASWRKRMLGARSS